MYEEIASELIAKVPIVPDLKKVSLFSDTRRPVKEWDKEKKGDKLLIHLLENNPELIDKILGRFCLSYSFLNHWALINILREEFDLPVQNKKPGDIDILIGKKNRGIPSSDRLLGVEVKKRTNLNNLYDSKDKDQCEGLYDLGIDFVGIVYFVVPEYDLQGSNVTTASKAFQLEQKVPQIIERHYKDEPYGVDFIEFYEIGKQNITYAYSYTNFVKEPDRNDRINSKNRKKLNNFIHKNLRLLIGERKLFIYTHR
jgi:hypothetical protein